MNTQDQPVTASLVAEAQRLDFLPTYFGPRLMMRGEALVYGVLSQNRRNFRHPSSSPATSASRSIILPSLWKV